MPTKEESRMIEVRNILSAGRSVAGMDYLQFNTPYGTLYISYNEVYSDRRSTVEVCAEAIYNFLSRHEQESCQTEITEGTQLELDLSV